MFGNNRPDEAQRPGVLLKTSATDWF